MKKYALLLSATLLTAQVFGSVEQSIVKQQTKDRIMRWSEVFKSEAGKDIKPFFVYTLHLNRIMNEFRKREVQGSDYSDLKEKINDIQARLKQVSLDLREKFEQNEELKKYFETSLNGFNLFVAQRSKASHTIGTEDEIPELEYYIAVIDYALEQID